MESSSVVWEYISKQSGNTSSAIFNVKKHTASKDNGPRRGSSLNKPEYSNNPDQYPENNKSGNVWYVKRSGLA